MDQELKNNEEFEVIDIKNKKILIKNDRLQIELSYQIFKHFDLAYCITTHVSQGSTYDFPYSIMSTNILINHYYIQVCQEAL